MHSMAKQLIHFSPIFTLRSLQCCLSYVTFGGNFLLKPGTTSGRYRVYVRAFQGRIESRGIALLKDIAWYLWNQS